MTYRLATIEDILAASDDGRITLLTGAGCSASAGIPLASQIAKEIRATLAAKNVRLGEDVGYAEAMNALVTRQRHLYVKRLCENAKINWAHIAIAQLLSRGVVDRILTTNFDPLIVKACSLIGEFPPVYDLAAAGAFTSSLVADKAIFHLHGQYAGFVQVHTKSAFGRVQAKLDAAVDACVDQRTWIVCGFSGESDPLIEVLAKRSFTSGLFWIGFEDAEPSDAVQEQILSKDDCFFVKGFDADRFFVEFAQRKDVFPPDFVDDPFSAVGRLIGLISPFKVDGAKEDVLDRARAKIAQAIASLRVPQEMPVVPTEPQEPVLPSPTALLIAAKYEEIVERFRSLTPDDPRIEEWKDAAIAALTKQGTELSERAETLKRHEAITRLDAAEKKFNEVLALSPQRSMTHNSLGNVYLRRARIADDPSAKAEAFAKSFGFYQTALEHDKDNGSALGNWGLALMNFAGEAKGIEGEQLLREAKEKLERALAIGPETVNRRNNLNDVLTNLVARTSGAERVELLKRIAENREMGERYVTAKGPAMLETARALRDWANAIDAKDAGSVFRRAADKYASAAKATRNSSEIQKEWADMILSWSKTQVETDAKAMLGAALEKYVAVNAMTPGQGAYNAACAAALLGNKTDAQQWLQIAQRHGTLPKAEWLSSDPDLSNVREEPWFSEFVISKP